jgi:hypothetical protein
MGIACPKPALPVVDEQFSPLIADDIAPGLDSFLLGWVNRRRALATGTPDCPAVFMRDDMLIAFAHN